MRFYFNAVAKVLIICTFWLMAGGCSKQEFFYDEGVVWHTSYHITYEAQENLIDSLLPVMNEVDLTLSPFNKQSAVSRLNKSGLSEAPDMLIKVLNKSKQICRASGGYFDPSVAPLIDIYGFGAGERQKPDSALIASTLAYVGMEKVQVKGKKITKSDPRMQFNFSAIAKGYGCDLVADKLTSLGVKNLMVEIGGEVVVKGVSPRGGKWNISVDRPIDSSEQVIHDSRFVIGITDCAVATSGSYRNYRETSEGKVDHIVNPLTGRAVEKEVIAATIVAPTCMEADAYATACMAMPRAQAEAFVKKMNLTAFLIFPDGTELITPSFRRLIVK